MNFSYWEHKSWLSHIDFAIVGSGIVGLSCALSLRKKYPKSTIRVFEQGLLPSGASTKNAGFACFGSVSEILDDLKTHSEEEVIQLVRERIKGLQLLRNTLGDELLDYQAHGGYEVFTKNDEELYETCVSEMSRINNLIKDAVFDEKEVFLLKIDPFSFKNVQKQLIFNQLEGQLDTGKMMLGLIQKCAKNDIIILNSAKISSFSRDNDEISLILNDFLELRARKLFIATNGFANRIIEQEVKPARAQVLITKPIKGLHLKGTFHLDRGYYYFRNIDNRVLLGGGRNLDFKGEQTTQLGLTELIQHKLEELLRTTILPNTAFEIESRWSGIMGVGGQKKPIVKELDANVYCGIRLGGMGVAIGSAVGQQLAQLA